LGNQQNKNLDFSLYWTNTSFEKFFQMENNSKLDMEIFKVQLFQATETLEEKNQ